MPKILRLDHHRGPRIGFAGHTIVISAVIGKSLSTSSLLTAYPLTAT
jgi:hypothetical protein